MRRVSKRFKRATLKRASYDTLKSSFIRRWFTGEKKPASYIEAVQELDLEITPGAAVGIVGRNGSGKSSLLKLITGIYRPDHGTVDVVGRVSALIELGAGFHPDFSGRENIYLGGVMYGLSREEIDARFDKIVRFAELEDFIDDPVRTYSSGMYMRLGFSLAVHTDPDILLIDEVLAVGDAHFIHKCKDQLGRFREQGKTMLIVSHDLSSITRWCDEAIWLDSGKVRKRGNPQQVVDAYLSDVEREEELELEEENRGRTSESAEEIPTDIQATEDSGRWGSRAAEILAVTMRNAAGEEQWLFKEGEGATIEVRYRINKPIPELVFGVGIIRADGICVLGTNTDIEDIKVPAGITEDTNAERIVNYRLKKINLLDGSYFLDVALHKEDGTPYDYHHRLYKFSVRSQIKRHGVFSPEHEWVFEDVA